MGHERREGEREREWSSLGEGDDGNHLRKREKRREGKRILSDFPEEDGDSKYFFANLKKSITITREKKQVLPVETSDGNLFIVIGIESIGCHKRDRGVKER